MDYVYNGILYHHGVKGMHWGVRKYQNLDGTLTAEGRKRYSTKNISSLEKQAEKLRSEGRDSDARKIERSLKKINKQRTYIDKDFAFTTLKDRVKANESTIHRDIERATTGTLNPFVKKRNAKAAYIASATKLLGDLKTPSGRTITWVENRRFHPSDKKVSSGNLLDKHYKTGLDIHPIFDEPKKKG